MYMPLVLYVAVRVGTVVAVSYKLYCF